MPNVHVNNTSTYFAVGQVLKTPVSFLVDTAAGLRGDIWNRVMPENNGMDKEVAYNLVVVQVSYSKICTCFEVRKYKLTYNLEKIFV